MCVFYIPKYYWELLVIVVDSVAIIGGYPITSGKISIRIETTMIAIQWINILIS